MFQRYVNDVESNYYLQAWNWVQRWAFSGYLLIGMIWLWSCPAHALDVDLATIWVAAYVIEPVESRVLTEMDAMDYIVLSTDDACCNTQLLCHTLSPLHFPL